ncbi:NAD-dependent epimerase/dehydratase family protein [Sphingomonas colocasiae]|uniref:NAD-dependent epimerase/dehydratase family protein n=1 Tax=Sphingomonas colocasiae TaxID=1848973 RepID=A0ABS7PHM5_9SPHN|nr:NAD-dependent epimerase/dehydratase family protein [Sphingomonas colocasiae]MBY8820794.1 NAD-dependent epimerase/dehydratase family protein [Sphingomonas colocasiae]
MRIGISGATGFVGRSLAARCVDEGNVVVPLLREAGGQPHAVAMGDLSAGTVPVLPELDAVVHLAAMTHSGVGDSAEVLQRYRAVNVSGTGHLLEAAARAGVRHFIFISSIKVNGERTAPGTAFGERDTPQPEDAYGRSKLEAEDRVRSFCEANDMAWTIVRPPLVYGASAPANFAALRKLALSRLPLPLGGFDALRSFVFVENLSDFICTALRDERARDRLFLVSDAQDIGVSDLIALMAREAGRPSRIFALPRWLLSVARHLPWTSSAIRKLSDGLQLDCSPACETLGWRPPYRLESGIRSAMAVER